MIQRTISLLALLLLALPLSPARAACTVPEPATANLVGHWTLDEPSGNPQDSSGNGNHGTLNGTGGGPDHGAEGKISNAMNFVESNSDYIAVPHSASLAITSSYTLSAWINPDTVSGGYMTFITKRNPTFANYYFEINNNEIGSGFIDNGGSWHAHETTNANLLPENWYHVTAVFDDSANRYKLYVNGIELLNAAETGTPYATGTLDLLISSANGIQYWDGLLDDVRIYNTALTADEVKQLYSATYTGGERGSVIYNHKNDAMQYCNGADEWVMMGTGSYNPTAVYFDGTTDSLSLLNETYPATKTVTGSFWFRKGTDSGAWNYILDSNLPGTVGFHIISAEGASDDIIFRGSNQSTGLILFADTAALSYGDWHHVLFSFDLSDTSKRHVYINGVADSTNYNNYVNDYFGTTLIDVAVGGEIGGSLAFDGDLADLWVDYGTYIDLSDPDNRRKFINESGMPMYLGPDGSIPTGAAPDIFLSGGVADWHTNKGTGGGFTENGALTDSVTQPGDSVITGSCGSLEQLDFYTGIAGALSGTPWGDGSYIYLRESNALQAYSFDGSALSPQGSAYAPPGVLSVGQSGVHGDRQYIYALGVIAGGDYPLYALTFDGTNWSNEASILVSDSAMPHNVWVQGNYIYVAAGDEGIHAYSFDGISFTSEGTWSGVGGNDIVSVVSDGNYVYASEGWTGSPEDVHALSFDGSNFTLLDTYDVNDGATSSNIWAAGGYIFASEEGATEIMALAFDGTSFTEIDTIDSTGLSRGSIWAEPDASHIYVTQTHSTADSIRAYAFDGATLAERGIYTFGTEYDYPALWSDGNYVYVPDDDDGIRVFSNLQKPGTVRYDQNFNVMTYCNGKDTVAMGPVGGTPPTNGLVGHWELDETSGTTANDLSGSGYNGTLYQMDFSSNSAPGRVGTALRLDGNNQTRVEADAPDNMTEFTACVWLNADTLINADGDSGLIILSKNWDIQVDDTSTGQMEFRIPTSDVYPRALSTTTISPGQWYHVCGVHYGVGTQPDLYVQGIEEGISKLSGTGTQSDDSAVGFFFGAPVFNVWSANFPGLLDDVRVYNRALSEKEIQQLYYYGLSNGLGDVDNACASPAEVEGKIIYNIDNDVMQYCNGEYWVGIGQ